MSRTSQELAEILDVETKASEATRAHPSGPGGVRKNASKSAIYSLRLTPQQIEQIQSLAQEHDVPASRLVRAWVVQRLTEERAGRGSIADLLEALTRDVDKLKRQLVKS